MDRVCATYEHCTSAIAEAAAVWPVVQAAMEL